MSTALDKTVARAEEFLKRFRERPVAHLIDGKPDAGSGETFETLSPIDNSVIRNSFFLRPVVLPTISPFSTDQSLSSPRQPVRSLPLKNEPTLSGVAASGDWVSEPR